MEWFRNLKTAHKIGTLLILISIFIITAGLISYYYDREASKMMLHIHSERFAAATELNSARVDIRANQAILYEIIFTSDKTKQNGYISEINRNDAEWEKYLSNYKAFNLNSYESVKILDLDKNIEKYKKVRSNVITLAFAGKSKEAYNYYQSNISLFNTLNKNLETLINYNLGQAHIEYNKSLKAHILAHNVSLIGMILTLAFSIPLGLLIAFMISDPLNKLLRNIEQVASGDLQVKDVEIKSRDEIGKLGQSFNTMTHNLRSLIEKEQFLRQTIVSSIESLNKEDILRTIVIETGKLFNADRCFFIEYDNENQNFLPIGNYEAYLSSLNIKDVIGLKLTKEQLSPFTRIMFNQKQVLAISDIKCFEIPGISKHLLEEYNIKSAIGAPIFYGNSFLGLLILHYVIDYKGFTQNDIDLLSAIAGQSAIIIHQAQLYDQIQETSNRERLLRTIINEVLTSKNLDMATQSITAEIGKLFDADRVVLRFYDKTLRAFSEVIGEYRRNEIIPSVLDKLGYPKELEDYLSREVFDKKNILVIDNIDDSKHPEFLRNAFKDLHIKSTLVAPVFYENIPVAAILIANTESYKDWERTDIGLLEPIIQQISIGIHLFSLNDRLSKALNNEKILREIITESRKFNEHDTIYNYLLNQLINIFNTNRCLHLHYDKNNNLFVKNEVIRNGEDNSLLGQTILSSEYTKEISTENAMQVTVINDVNQEISNSSLREYLKTNGIQSYLLYSTAQIFKEKMEDKILGLTLVCFSVPKKWSSNEIEFFKLVIDAVSIIFLEVRQRQKTEELRNTFLATLTHDLRSPINAEQKAFEAILSKKLGTSLENYSEVLDDMYKTNEDLLRIINNILTIYHYESGKFELNMELGDIGNIIEDSVKSVIYLAKDQNSEIITNIQPDLPSIMMDKVEINRAVTNLISNAIKHTRKNTSINISARKTDNNVEVSISDNGQGIPEAEKPNIFQRYPTTKRKIGTGLGLYLTKQIIDAHNGKIWFMTHEGKGTTFSFTLPL
jgi:signal transduction histidine kinase/transcriptional regulator with GAF, ATPase, and Fis domain